MTITIQDRTMEDGLEVSMIGQRFFTKRINADTVELVPAPTFDSVVPTLQRQMRGDPIPVGNRHQRRASRPRS